MSKCLMIVGMHRSGTSLLSSILQKAGLFIGEELMEAGIANKKGHFENIDFYNFQAKVFKSLSLDTDGWDLQTISTLNEEFDKEAEAIILKNNKAEWGWKEPRTTLFLNYWANKIPSIKYVFVYRDPWDVADSLYRRSSDPKIIANPIHALDAWNFYNQEIIKMYKKNMDDSILIHIDDITKDTASFVKSINSKLGFHLNPNVVGDIFDKSLYKESNENLFYKRLTALAFPTLIDTLNELNTLANKPTFHTEILSPDQMSKEMTNQFISGWQELYIQKKEIKLLGIELDNQKRELAWIKNTKYWKIRLFVRKLMGKKS